MSAPRIRRERPRAAPRAPREGGSSREERPNGAVLTSLALPHVRHVALAIAVRVGSRHEPESLGGISHFLEHMLFRGTPEHPTSFAQNFAFESLGGTLDAATSAETTVFSASVPRQAAPAALALVAEMFREPVMAHLELERNVVREELLDALDEDEKLIDADELAAQALYGPHPLGHAIGGTVASLGALTEADLRAWHRTHYVGQNLVVAIAGAVDDATLGAARRAFDAVPAGVRSAAAPFAATAAATRARLVDTTGSQVDLRASFLVPGVRDPRWPAITMLTRILDDGMSARVFRTMIEDRGLAYEAFGDLDPYSDVSSFSLGAACRPESAPDAAEALLALARGAGQDITDAEITRVRTRVLFELDLARESPEAHVDLLLGHELDGQTASLDELAARAASLTRADLEDAARAIFRREALSFVAVGPLDAKQRKKIREAANGF